MTPTNSFAYLVPLTPRTNVLTRMNHIARRISVVGAWPNRSFDTDTQWHSAAKRVGERTPRGAMPLRAGQLQR